MKADKKAEAANQGLAAIADATRRGILKVLKQRGCCSIGRDSGMCACDVEERMNLTQPTISHHMKVLSEAGLVQAEKIGKWMWYRRNEANIRQLLKELQADL